MTTCILNGGITKSGQWTIWGNRWCKVERMEGEAAYLQRVEYPVGVKHLERCVQIIRPEISVQMPSEAMYLTKEAYKEDIERIEQAYDEIVIPDEYWNDFVGLNISDDKFIIKSTNKYGKYTKMAIPYEIAKITLDVTRLRQRAPENVRSGVERVIDALQTNILKNPMEHDDMFQNHELASAAMYQITRNTNLLGKTLSLPERSDRQTIQDLTEAAAILVCEIDRILRKKL